MCKALKFGVEVSTLSQKIRKFSSLVDTLKINFQPGPFNKLPVKVYSFDRRRRIEIDESKTKQPPTVHLAAVVKSFPRMSPIFEICPR